VRRFSALRPYDEAWQAWTSPLSEALFSRLEALANLEIQQHWRAAAWASHLSDLWLNWKSLTIQELAYRARCMALLAEGDESTATLEPGTNLDWLPTDGEELPAVLASLFGLRLRPGGIKIDTSVAYEPVPEPKPEVELRWLAPQTLLARFTLDLANKSVCICVPSSCEPPEQILVQGGPAVGGFRIKNTIPGEDLGSQRVYRLHSSPRPGETFRFQPLGQEAAALTTVHW
jgi:hypothetical protein